MKGVFSGLIVSAFAVLTLAGCGSRGPLYLPTVPPMPPAPDALSRPPTLDHTGNPATAPGATPPATRDTPR